MLKFNIVATVKIKNTNVLKWLIVEQTGVNLGSG